MKDKLQMKRKKKNGKNNTEKWKMMKKKVKREKERGKKNQLKDAKAAFLNGQG